MLAKIQDRNPIIISDMDDGVITYQYEGDAMSEPHVTPGGLFYQMELDLDARALYVHMKKGEYEIHSIPSADGNAVVDYYWGTDGLPNVVGVEILNPNMISIIQDWIEDGVEACMSTLNSHPRHCFEDDHWKGVLVEGE
jgi:hypothetical protein